MYRKVYKDLLQWKESGTRKPLLLLGARQVGKTWLMKEFGQHEYRNYVYINCDEEPLMQTLFTTDYDIRRLTVAFQAISGETIVEGETLIILDEIQEAPRGLHSLKYFCENARGLHIMAAGSLLGIALSHDESFPVGKVDTLEIHPLDFGEFLDALGEKSLNQLLADDDHSLADAFAPRLADLLHQYWFVGGMPEVVASFAARTDLNEVRKLQREIIAAYQNDIAKHTTKTEAVRIGQVLASLPSQLAKENKRFIFGAAKQGGRAADFEVAIQWLVDAGLVQRVNRVSKIAIPLKFYEELNVFKLFYLDIGLLCAMSDVPPRIMIAETDLMVEYKGMIAEQYVAQQLEACGIRSYYWSNDTSPAELDFIVQGDTAAIAIEVKASKSVQGKSLGIYLAKNPEAKAVRFSLRDYSEKDRLVNIPLYGVTAWAQHHSSSRRQPTKS